MCTWANVSVPVLLRRRAARVWRWRHAWRRSVHALGGTPGRGGGLERRDAQAAVADGAARRRRAAMVSIRVQMRAPPCLLDAMAIFKRCVELNMTAVQAPEWRERRRRWRSSCFFWEGTARRSGEAMNEFGKAGDFCRALKPRKRIVVSRRPARSTLRFWTRKNLASRDARMLTRVHARECSSMRIFERS
eukprot:1962539-Pleurochrysis_carterae.AAC.1